MAYDESLAERIRDVLGAGAGITEKRMFGGIAFLLDGKMFCGIAKGELMVRVGPEGFAEVLAEPHVRPMDFTGRPMKGYVYVDAAGYRTEAGLAFWVNRGSAFVRTLGGDVRPPARRKRKERGK